MLWFVILGILLLLILAIIITMVKIIRGSNDLQEMRERPSGRGGAQMRENRKKGGSMSSDNRGSNSKMGNRRSGENREVRPAPAKKREREARGGRRWKVILVDVATHEEYEFIFSDMIGIGRVFAKEGYEDYLVINDPKVSKRHCSIFAEGDNLYIQDEGSSNHTFVNNLPVNRPMRIQKEDMISIGNTDLEIYKVFRESR